MSKQLSVNVVVVDDDGNTVLLEAGSTVPKWASDQVGDHCFAGKESSSAKDEEVDPGVEPARSGRGSSVEAWTAFATEKGHTVEPGTSRDQIIADLITLEVIES